MTVAEAIRPLAGEASDYDLVVERAAGARFALLGEASHGTHEFYKERAEITRRLITEQGFGFVAVEGDWPDAYRVNRYVRGESDDGGPEEALGDFRRFPSWMWRNTDVVDFVAWLREWNDALPLGEPRVGFYGLDLYSLYTSMEEVIRYLDEIDPEAAQRARERYSCFDHFGRDPQTYAYQAVTGGTEPCEPQVVRQLIELLSRRLEISEDETILDGDRQFYAEQNARLVVNAERYYRAAFWGGPESWNLRDRHMVETLEALVDTSSRLGERSRARSGRTTLTWATRGRPRWAGGESSTSASWCAGATATRRSSGALRRSRGPSRPPRTGELWPSARTSGLRVRTAGSGSSTTPGCRAS